MKCIICMLVQLNTLCLIWISRQYPQNWILKIEFDNDAWVLLNFYSKYSKRRTISNTDEIQHVRSNSECLPSECWGEENISRKALGLWFLSLFQNMVRRTLCLCSQVLNKQCLLLWERSTYSNKVYRRQLAVPRTTTSCSSRAERHARHWPNCRLPAFQCAWVHWTRELAAEQFRSKSRGLFSVDSVAADGVTSQNFRNWSAEASSDRLLGSAKPGHIELSDWSAAKRTEDDYQGKGRSCWILSRLTICVRDRPCFIIFRMKIEQNSCVIVKFNAISGVLTIYAN